MRRLSDGRTRRSRDEWGVLLARLEKSGLSEAAFCERERISRSSLSHWKRRLAEERTREGSSPFVELRSSGQATPSPIAGEFELSLPGGVTLRWKA